MGLVVLLVDVGLGWLFVVSLFYTCLGLVCSAIVAYISYLVFICVFCGGCFVSVWLVWLVYGSVLVGVVVGWLGGCDCL